MFNNDERIKQLEERVKLLEQIIGISESNMSEYATKFIPNKIQEQLNKLKTIELIDAKINEQQQSKTDQAFWNQLEKNTKTKDEQK